MKSQEQYSEEGGMRCPNSECNGIVIHKSSINLGGGEGFIPCYCANCGLEWTEEYMLTGYSIDED